MLLKELGFLHSTLQAEIGLIGFVHVLSLFLGHNDKVLKQKKTIQQKKLNNLLKDKEPQHNTEKIILFYSRYVLSEVDKSLLQNGLNLAFHLKNLIMLITLLVLNYFTEIFATFRFFLQKIWIL